MSFPLKEELFFIEQLSKRQVRIYGDACDVGVYLTPGQLTKLRNALKELKTFYGGKNWSCSAGSSHQGMVKNIIIPFEVEGERARGVEVSVNVVKETKVNKTWASIGIEKFDLDVSDVPSLNQSKD